MAKKSRNTGVILWCFWWILNENFGLYLALRFARNLDLSQQKKASILRHF